MIEVANIDGIIHDTFEVLIRDSKWDICFESLYIDYAVYIKGQSDYQSIGWQWDNPGENVTRCVKIARTSITDYYISYEKYSTYRTGIFSRQVNPTTLEPICEYRVTDDGVHKYSMSGDVIQPNIKTDDPVLTMREVVKDTNIPTHYQGLLTSRKPYGDIVYLDMKNSTFGIVATLVKQYKNGNYRTSN